VKPVSLPDHPNALSCSIGFVDAHGIRRFDLHCYALPDGTIVSRSALLDPVYFLDDDNVAYKLDQ
jgi:hypothetical protein